MQSQQIGIANERRIEADLHHLGMPGSPAAHLIVVGINRLPAGIATEHAQHTGQLCEERLSAPEAAAAEDRHFSSTGVTRNPAQGQRIDAVAQALRCRAIGEYVPEVRLADIAQGLDTLTAARSVTGIGHRSFVDRLREERPGSKRLHIAELKGFSVPFRRITSNCSGLSRSRHSASL
jgi:hypothetical protein